MIRRSLLRGILPALILLHAGLALHSLWGASATFDEPDYTGAGCYVFHTGNWKFSSANFHPPLSYYLNSLPLFFLDIPDEIWRAAPPAREGNNGWVWYDVQIGGRLLFEDMPDRLLVLRLARLPTVLLSCCLLAVIFYWTRLRSGETAAALAGALYALSPDFLAHARLVTTDICLALFLTAHFWVLWMLAKEFRWWKVIASAIFAGAILGSKLNGIFALPAGAILLVLALRRHGQSLGRTALTLGFYSVLPVLILWALYGLTIAPPQEPGQEGAVVAMITQRLPGPVADAAARLVQVPLPLSQYARMFATIYAYSRRGAPAFLMGEIHERGVWYYFPVALAVKTPIPILIFLVAGIILFLRTRHDWLDRLAILLPIAVIFLPAVTGSLNIGIRHILPALPFLFVIAGGSAALFTSMPRRCAAAALIAWLVVGSVRAHPSHLSYFNELAGGMGRGEEWLSDSNIDWGEDFIRLARFQKENGIDLLPLAYFAPYDPAAYGVRHREITGPTAGWVAVEIMRQQFSRRENPNPLAWLDAYQPVARIGGSIKVYNIPAASLPH